MKNSIAVVFLAAAMASSAQHSGVEQRGDHAMGFSHEKTTHHFLLAKDGGAIEVEANDAKDKTSRDQIRGHLTHIAKMFAAGNFETPMLIHDQVPPGVPVMQQLKAEIDYKFEQTAKGARIRIFSSNAEAIAAVHEFLKFQIKDHHTGDPIEIR